MYLDALEERAWWSKGSYDSHKWYETHTAQQWSDHTWITVSSFGHPSSGMIWRNDREPNRRQKGGLGRTAAEGADLFKLVKGESEVIQY